MIAPSLLTLLDTLSPTALDHWHEAIRRVGAHLLDCRQLPRCVAGGFQCSEGAARHAEADRVWDDMEAAREGAE